MTGSKFIFLVSISTIFGIVLGVFLASLSMTAQKGLHRQAVEAIAQCEKELPRNQHCEIVILAKVKKVIHE